MAYTAAHGFLLDCILFHLFKEMRGSCLVCSPLQIRQYMVLAWAASMTYTAMHGSYTAMYGSCLDRGAWHVRQCIVLARAASHDL